MKKRTMLARIGTALLIVLGLAKHIGKVYEAEAWLQGVYGVGFLVTLLWTGWGMANLFFPKDSKEWHWPETPYYVKGRWARFWWPLGYLGEAAVAVVFASLFSAWFWFLWSWEPHLLFRPFIWYRNQVKNN